MQSCTSTGQLVVTSDCVCSRGVALVAWSACKAVVHHWSCCLLLQPAHPAASVSCAACSEEEMHKAHREMQGHVLPGGRRMKTCLPVGTAPQPAPDDTAAPTLADTAQESAAAAPDAVVVAAMAVKEEPFEQPSPSPAAAAAEQQQLCSPAATAAATEQRAPSVEAPAGTAAPTTPPADALSAPSLGVPIVLPRLPHPSPFVHTPASWAAAVGAAEPGTPALPPPPGLVPNLASYPSWSSYPPVSFPSGVFSPHSDMLGALAAQVAAINRQLPTCRNPLDGGRRKDERRRKEGHSHKHGRRHSRSRHRSRSREASR